MHTSLLDLLADSSIPHKAMIKRIVANYHNRDPSDCIAHQDDTIDPVIMNRILDDYSDFRDKHKPIEYILGRCEFLGRKFIVTPATLIPRAETEYMIIAVRDRVINHTQTINTNSRYLYDIGTGSGVLGISVDCETGHTAKHVMMTDIDPQCLVVAQQNLEKLVDEIHHDRFHLQTADLCDFLTSSSGISHKSSGISHHVFVSNLPYIPDQAFYESSELSVRKREPHHAFVGGDDGLDLYRRQLRQRQEWKNTNSVSTIMFCEMMTWQAEILGREFPHLIQTVHHTFHANIIILSME